MTDANYGQVNTGNSRLASFSHSAAHDYRRKFFTTVTRLAPLSSLCATVKAAVFDATWLCFTPLLAFAVQCKTLSETSRYIYIRIARVCV